MFAKIEVTWFEWPLEENSKIPVNTTRSLCQHVQMQESECKWLWLHQGCLPQINEKGKGNSSYSVLCSLNVAMQRNLSLPARFGDDHLSPDVMEPLPEVGTLQLHLNLLHGRHGSRHGACSSGAQVAVSVKGAGSPLGEHLRV